MSGAKLAPTPENIGATLARNMFKSRGDHFEIHLLERDLALLIKGGCEIALDGVGTANVEALNKTRDALTMQFAELLVMLRWCRESANRVYQMGDAEARRTLVDIFERTNAVVKAAESDGPKSARGES